MFVHTGLMQKCAQSFSLPIPPPITSAELLPCGKVFIIIHVTSQLLVWLYLTKESDTLSLQIATIPVCILLYCHPCYVQVHKVTTAAISEWITIHPGRTNDASRKTTPLPSLAGQPLHKRGRVWHTANFVAVAWPQYVHYVSVNHMHICMYMHLA